MRDEIRIQKFYARFPFCGRDGVYFTTARSLWMMPYDLRDANLVKDFRSTILDCLMSFDTLKVAILTEEVDAEGKKSTYFVSFSTLSPDNEIKVQVPANVRLIGWLERENEVILGAPEGVTMYAMSMSDYTYRPFPCSYMSCWTNRLDYDFDLITTGLVAPSTWKGYRGGDLGRVWRKSLDGTLECLSNPNNMSEACMFKGSVFALCGTKEGCGIMKFDSTWVELVSPRAFPPPKHLSSTDNGVAYMSGGRIFITLNGDSFFEIKIHFPEDLGYLFENADCNEIKDISYLFTRLKQCGYRYVDYDVEGAAKELLNSTLYREDLNDVLKDVLGTLGMSHTMVQDVRDCADADVEDGNTRYFNSLVAVENDDELVSYARTQSFASCHAVVSKDLFYLRLPDTSQRTYSYCREVLDAWGDHTMILDVRCNEGGNRGYSIANDILSCYTLKKEDCAPLAVICDSRTGSGGELLVKLLQDKAGAQVFGWVTSGAGSAYRAMNAMEYDWRFVFPECVFVDRNGKFAFENKGVRPDRLFDLRELYFSNNRVAPILVVISCMRDFSCCAEVVSNDGDNVFLHDGKKYYSLK